jgi:hypothetical protein
MRRILLTAALAVCVSTLSTHAAIGIGVHWGFDWSVDMDDAEGEQLVFDDITLDASAVEGPMPSNVPSEIPGNLLPIYVNRTNFDRTVVNFGGKVLVDALKWFDIEGSLNFGLWEYEGQIVYPVSLQFDPNGTPTSVEALYDMASIDFDTLDVNAEALNVPYWGLDNTPYAKLHFDVTVRKSFLTIPKRLKTFSLYAGGGVSLHFATPVLSAPLIEEALGNALDQSFQTVQELGPELLGNEALMDAVLEQITDGLTEPKWGMHLVAGTQLKVPVIPIAFYVDGKLMIPFGQLDPHVDVNGVGFLVNGGVMLKF